MKLSNKWVGITIHHSATKDSATKSWDAIKKYHIETNGWDDIGYHFGVELVGDSVIVYEGRDLKYQGAHCPQLNSTRIGICLVGDYDKEEPSEQHIKVLLDLCVKLIKRFNLSPNCISYHSEYSSKTCPGSKFPKDEFRKLVMKEVLPACQI